MTLLLPSQALRTKGKRSWKQLGPREKAQLLGALDSISFDFVQATKENGGRLADAWLWQVRMEVLPFDVQDIFCT